MKKNKLTFNQNGMSLVEILAALVILGIVFVGFMTIFPQMTNFNDKTETKLETMNQARVELERWKTHALTIGSFGSEEITKHEHFYRIKYGGVNEGMKCEVQVDYYIVPDLSKNNEQETQLNKIHITILQDEKEISETFGYIEG